MADGLTRLLAPILSFTADELWRHLPGAREESVHLALFPDRGGARRAASIRRWSSAGTTLVGAARAGARRDRAAAQEQADRQLAAGQGRHLGDDRRAAAARAVRQAAADAVHRLRGRAAAGTGRCGATSRAAHRHRARRRREVRALLALSCRRCRASRHRPGSATAARTRWPRRSMDNASRRSSPATSAAPPPQRLIEFCAADGHRRRRSGDQGAGPRARCRCTTASRSSRVPRLHARAEHRRGVRDPQRRRLSVQDGGDRGHRDRRR